MDGVSQTEYRVKIPPSNPRSPTPSNMGYDEDKSVFGLNTITLDEEFKFPFSESEKTKFYSKENKYKRKWFFMKDQKEQEMWIKKYKLFLNKMGNELPENYDIFIMIEKSYKIGKQKDSFPDFDDLLTVFNINSAYKEYTTKARKIIKSIHPPEVNLSVKIDKEEIVATPSRKDWTFEAIIE